MSAFAKITFSHALKQIWAQAKREAAKAEPEKAMREEHARVMAAHQACDERVAALTGGVRERLVVLENAKFMLSMKDSWDSADYSEDSRLHKVIEEIKNAA